MSNALHYQYIVAEDESLIRNNLIKKINSLNLPLTLVGEAANGLEAITLIEKHCPSLIITDIRMPQCDGIEVIRYLHQNHPGIKTIILSGFNDFTYAQTAIRYEVRDYLLKPLKMEELSETLHKLLISLDAESGELDSYRADGSRLEQSAIYKLLERYLQEHYQTDISLQSLADKFGFSPEYISKIFKKYAGVTPSKYLTRLRINEAKRLLICNPEIEIQKVGELVGYKDNFYFSRVFKNQLGIQPSEFRNKRE